MGEAKCATLRIVAPESARRATTSIAIDHRHPSPPGMEVDLDGELSLARGQVCDPVVPLLLLDLTRTYASRFGKLQCRSGGGLCSIEGLFAPLSIMAALECST